MRLRQSTKVLCKWIDRVHHQMWMTKQLQGKTKGQLTLREALGHYDKCPP
jgi:hypothetical protein